MTNAFTRSTWAYATILFVVLFAPQVGREHMAGADRLWSLFPDGLTLLAVLVIQFLAVRQGMAGAEAGAVVPGIARGCAVACSGAVLYGIGVAVMGPAVFTDAGFTWTVATFSVVAVAAIGSVMAVAFSFMLRRRTSGR